MKIWQVPIILGLLCGHLAAQSASKRFTLSGTVVDGSNQPVAGVEVSVTVRDGGSQDVDTVTTDGQGRFGFRGLPAGEYHLWAEGSGFGRVPYGEAAEPGRGTAIQLGGDSGDKSLVFRILPRADVAGTIRDEFGDPMVNAIVALLRPIWRDGRTTTMSVGQKSTDDRGRYRFGNLAPGGYMVCVGGQGVAAPQQGPVDYATRVDRYYGRTCNRAFPLSPGQDAQVDLTPVAGGTANVRGHVRNLAPQTGFSANLFPDGPQAVSQPASGMVDALQGTFTFRGIAPGRYRLRLQSFSGTGHAASTAEIPLDVGSSDIDGLEVELGSQATVEVAFPGVASNDVGATLRGEGGSLWGQAQSKGGNSQFQLVPPGNYRLRLRTPEGSCVASVKLGDSEMRGKAFGVAAGAALHFDVALTQNCGAIHARAVRDGSPVAGAKMVLLISGTPGDPGDLREEVADDQGEFTFSGLTPGKYLLWAWALDGPGAMAGPTSLADVEQRATAVDLAAGGAAKVDVPLLPAEGQ